MTCRLTPPSAASWTAMLQRHRAQLANERALRDEADETIEQLRESLESRDITISRLRAELTRRESECDRLASDFAGSIARIADLELDLVDQRTASIGLRALVDKRTDELLAARAEVERLHEQVDEWRSEAADARRDADEWQERSNELLSEVGRLQAALESSERIRSVVWPAKRETPESIRNWARCVFELDRLESVPELTKKLLIEVAELDRAVNDPGASPEQCLEELADVKIVLARLDMSAPSERLGVAIDRKMAVNRQRIWRRLPDGTWQHVEEVAA